MLDIPGNKLNGYNIIAQAPVISGDGTLATDVRVILGHDPSRRYPKYVTALTTQGTVDTHREWYWGHYFEGTPTALQDAMRDFIERIQLPARLPADADV